MIIKASALVKNNSLISTLILVHINHTSKSNKYFSWFVPDKRAGFPSRTPVMSLEYFVCERLISWRLQRLSKPGVQLQAGHISLRWRITKVCYHQLFKKRTSTDFAFISFRCYENTWFRKRRDWSTSKMRENTAFPFFDFDVDKTAIFKPQNW